MNRFVIVDGLPYLLSKGKTYSVRWDEQGFTVGAEVELTSVPVITHSERAIKAKCASCLDSIGNTNTDKDNDFDNWTVAELKAYADEHGIELGNAKKKADIIDILQNGGA